VDKELIDRIERLVPLLAVIYVEYWRAISNQKLDKQPKNN